MLHSMWALSSPTKGQTHAPWIALRALTSGLPFEVLKCPFFFCSLKMPSHSLSEDFEAQKPPLWGRLCCLPPHPQLSECLSPHQAR